MSQNPEIFGMHDNVDISRELQETKQVTSMYDIDMLTCMMYQCHTYCCSTW